jgi:nucleotide-binding universal stress UspA family protein
MLGSHTDVLVGYDGSPESAAALRWAIDEARWRRWGITVCHVWHWPYELPDAKRGERRGHPDSEARLAARATVRRLAEQTAAAGADVVATTAPGLRVQARAVSGPTAEMLLAMSSGADAIVVGHRGGGGFAEVPIGSVAGQLAGHAGRPVFVIRGASAGGGEIVAGVDDSAMGDAVLAFALEEAALRRVPVRAVCSWWDVGAMPARPTIETDKLRREAAARFERLLVLWREKYPYVMVRPSLMAEPARTALLAATRGAGLLVVGRHGHGDGAGALGSVGQAMVQGAACPVAVVAPPLVGDR